MYQRSLRKKISLETLSQKRFVSFGRQAGFTSRKPSIVLLMNVGKVRIVLFSLVTTEDSKTNFLVCLVC